MGSSPLSSRELVEQLWNDVRARDEVSSKTTLPDLPAHEQLMHGEALRYINSNWEGTAPAPGTAERTSLKARARRRLAHFVVGLFGDYLEAERQFNANVVRVANGLASGHDRIAGEVRQVAEGVRTESQRLSDDFEAMHRLLEARVAALEEARSAKR